MKFSELKPCAICGGKIAPLFYRVTVEQIIIDPKAAGQLIGLTTFFGGSLKLAEVFAPVEDVTLTTQENAVILCDNCAYSISLVRVLFGVESQEAPAP